MLCAAGESVPTHWVEVDALAAHLVHTVAAAGNQVPHSVLVKGSRFMRMERVVQALQTLDASKQAHKDALHAA